MVSFLSSGGLGLRFAPVVAKPHRGLAALRKREYAARLSVFPCAEYIITYQPPENVELQMQNTLYNGTAFIPFTIPKFLAEIRIA